MIESKVWLCKNCNLRFGAPMIDSNFNNDNMLGRCPYCGSRNIKLDDYKEKVK